MEAAEGRACFLRVRLKDAAIALICGGILWMKMLFVLLFEQQKALIDGGLSSGILARTGCETRIIF